MKNKVTSLELSKKLKELGVPQVSEFYWHYVSALDRYMILSMKASDDTKGERYSAFLSCELGEMLPAYISGKDSDSASDVMTLTCDKGEGIVWGVWYEHFDRKKSMLPQAHEYESEARGAMLAYLRENNLIEGYE